MRQLLLAAFAFVALGFSGCGKTDTTCPNGKCHPKKQCQPTDCCPKCPR